MVSPNVNFQHQLLIIKGMPLGLIYELNFSTPFNFSQNISQVLTSISKAPNSGAANNFAPQYYDGALFANDGEFFTYGGLLTQSDAFEAPRADSVLGYEKYWYGPAGKQFTPGFIAGELPNNVTRYVTYGGSVNVPSENKGYYFGGMKQSRSGPIFYPSANTSLNPDTYSNTLISIDMANQQNEVWTNETVPSNIPGRANPELVWVPVGNKGLLIAIGGVVDPVYAQPASFLNATQLANSVSPPRKTPFPSQKLIHPSKPTAPPSLPPSLSTISTHIPGTRKTPAAARAPQLGRKAAPSSPPPPTGPATTSITTAVLMASPLASPSTTTSGSSPSPASCGCALRLAARRTPAPATAVSSPTRTRFWCSGATRRQAEPRSPVSATASSRPSTSAACSGWTATTQPSGASTPSLSTSTQ